MVAFSLSFGDWSNEDIVSAFHTSTSLDSRLAVLWRFEEALNFLGSVSQNVDQRLRTQLVQNLGYVDKHPLASVVRELALDCCIQMGKNMVPYLLSINKVNPWQFHANILLALGSIAPENSEFRLLLEEARKDSRSQIRLHVLMSIGHHEAQWTRELVERMLFDSASKVAKKAAEVLGDWDIKAGVMSFEEKKARSVMVQTAMADDPKIRESVIWSFSDRRPVWARIIVERLSHDSDRSVRKRAQELLEIWEKEIGEEAD